MRTAPRGLRTQLFVGGEPRLANFTPAVNDPNMAAIRKPRGGLWTSTYDPESGSDWVQWCLREDWGVPGAGWAAWLLEPEPDTQRLRIDSLADLQAALDRHGMLIHERYPNLGRTFDFERLALDYDAIHLTHLGQARTRLTFPDTLYGWDCETVLWLRWRFVSITGLGQRCWPETD